MAAQDEEDDDYMSDAFLNVEYVLYYAENEYLPLT